MRFCVNVCARKKCGVDSKCFNRQRRTASGRDPAGADQMRAGDPAADASGVRSVTDQRGAPCAQTGEQLEQKPHKRETKTAQLRAEILRNRCAGSERRKTAQSELEV